MSNRFAMAWDSSSSRTQVKIQNIEGSARPESQTFHFLPIQTNEKMSESLEVLVSALEDKLTHNNLALKDCVALCAGLNAYTRPALAEELTYVLSKRGFFGPAKFCSDFEIALWGALGQIPDENGMIKGGAALISGKSSICFGQSTNGKRHRAGGYGQLLDNAGSGFSIGRSIISSILRASDKRIKETALTQLVFEHFEIHSIGELLGKINHTNYIISELAYLAPILDLALELEDEQACRIADEAALDLVDLARPVIHGLGAQGLELGLAGGILMNSRGIRERVLKLLQEEFPSLDAYAARKSGLDAALEYAHYLSVTRG
ncbi:MAG: BadF/BadG/BcrA/BcrD ATPase family protein [Gallicola sp.]|nr:BadF/BadG/BcrA/BcrD ATPase family protein [Gallicola sp.]